MNIKIDQDQLQKKIYQVVFKDIEKLNNKIDTFFQKLYAVEEKIKCLEEKEMKNNFDEFEYADMQNDEKKLEAMEIVERECEFCGNTFPQDELDLHEGSWLCKDCEEEVNKVEDEE